MRVTTGDFNACYDVRFDAAHKVHFDPVVVINLLAVLRVEPSNVLAVEKSDESTAKSVSIEWQAASRNKLSRDRRHEPNGLFVQSWLYYSIPDPTEIILTLRRFKIPVIDAFNQFATLQAVRFSTLPSELTQLPGGVAYETTDGRAAGAAAVALCSGE